MKSRHIDIVLLVAGLTAMLLAIKTSDDAYPWENRHPIIESIFDQFETGNELLFNLSVGSAVAVLFYFLIVWYPERRKRRILRNSLREQYHRFRRSTISILLGCCNEVQDYSLVERLDDPEEFRKYFSEDVTGTGRRMYDVMNNLEDWHLQELRIELEMLRDELAYIISQVDISEPKILDFFKNLSQYVYRMQHLTLEYDEIKSLSNFLWQMFANFDFATGISEDDIIEVMIQKIG
ncbi:MAG: hypothetical protein ACYTAS_12825 [Planctomycetota bacterium]|jgi:hypothetical protein